MEFKRIKLDNGLEIIGEMNKESYSLSLGTFVRTGARDENDAISGCSHFLEHMIFKGTEKRTAAEVNRELDELGGRSNAYTSDESTVFYASVLPELRPRIT
ncbi:MAG: insulinase family protein, partial [Planctomycetia bacterium]|nr:insulinase family protein [Planctomycetia bacterium]